MTITVYEEALATQFVCDCGYHKLNKGVTVVLSSLGRINKMTSAHYHCWFVDYLDESINRRISHIDYKGKEIFISDDLL